jgi:hypothetical protein
VPVVVLVAAVAVVEAVVAAAMPAVAATELRQAPDGQTGPGEKEAQMIET